MNDPARFEHCLSFINYQVNPDHHCAPTGGAVARPAVTISRQAGCGALEVAEKLAARLQAANGANPPPWTIFDRNLMDKVLEDHNLPTRLARFLPEDRMTELQDITDELFGLRPASWTLIQQTSETVLKLAALGHVILIGRGANIIAAKLPHVVHVRLVSPREVRVNYCVKHYAMTREQAREFCRREDEGRRRYLKKYFDADVDDPLLYHLTINTGAVSFDVAAHWIADAVKGVATARGVTGLTMVRNT